MVNYDWRMFSRLRSYVLNLFQALANLNQCIMHFIMTVAIMLILGSLWLVFFMKMARVGQYWVGVLYLTIHKIEGKEFYRLAQRVIPWR